MTSASLVVVEIVGCHFSPAEAMEAAASINPEHAKIAATAKPHPPADAPFRVRR
jgi:Ni,Fe-hydrogenase III small subunit